VSVYLLRRILATIPVMGVVAVFVFSLLHLTPGDPAVIVAGDFATAEDIARYVKQTATSSP
jgi:peptide/nickel transport system permease protein